MPTVQGTGSPRLADPLHPPWLAQGALARLGQNRRLYGWEAGRQGGDASAPLTLPGHGTQSWLYMPLISLALLDVELSRGEEAYSSGDRDPVPREQEVYWRTLVAQTAALSDHEGCVLTGLAQRIDELPPQSAAARALRDPGRWQWRYDGVRYSRDHLCGADQELVLGEVESLLPALLLTMQMAGPVASSSDATGAGGATSRETGDPATPRERQPRGSRP